MSQVHVASCGAIAPFIRNELRYGRETDFATIRKAAVNGRDVRHMTRIVGYFSNTRNWNQSKIGELKDRHKGNYGVAKA